jgi:hypothetical protein
MGKKTPKDISICLKTFQNITKEQWTAMCQLEGNVIEVEKVAAKSPEELRAARLKYYESNNVQS